MKKKWLPEILLLLTLIINTGIYASETTQIICKNADRIFHNATFITLNPKKPSAEALAVTHHRIVAIGDKTTIFKQCKGKNTTLFDLKKTVVTPGFIDTGSQMRLYGILALHSIDLSTTNSFQRQDWQPLKSTEEFLKSLKAKIPAGKQWIIAYGYDQSRLKGRPLTQAMLNDISNSVPIMIINSTGNEALLNNKAVIEIKKFEKTITVDDKGILKKGSLHSLLEQLFDRSSRQEALSKAAKEFSSRGYTTVSDNLEDINKLSIYTNALSKNSFPLDIILNSHDLKNKKRLDLLEKDYARLFSGFYIIQADGVLRNYEAFLTEPYFQETDHHGNNWRGTLIEDVKDIEKKVMAAAKNGITFAFEAQGDAAIDIILNMTQKAQNTFNKQAIKPRLFNAQVIRNDQLQRMNYLGMSANWFAPHLYYWGEAMCHEITGPNRANHNNPLHSANKNLGSISIYLNSPATPILPLEMMQRVQTRRVQSWLYPLNLRCLQYYGPNERITALEALKALTLGPAELYGLEKDKGSLEVGKIADMTILNANPLEDETWGYIKVLGTITRGQIHMNPTHNNKNNNES